MHGPHKGGQHKPDQGGGGTFSQPGQKRRNKSARAREAKRLRALAAADSAPMEVDLDPGTGASASTQHHLARGTGSTLEGNATEGEGSAALASSSPPYGFYDRVLVDAECSHDGSAKHLLKLTQEPDPAARLRAVLCEERGEALVQLQRALIRNGFSLLVQGGILIYSTCSLTRSQNEGVVSWLLSQEAEAELVPVDYAQTSGAAAGQPPDIAAPSKGTMGAAGACDDQAQSTEQSEPSKPRASGVSGDVTTWGSGSLPFTLRFGPAHGTSGLFVARIRRRKPGPV